MIAKLTSQKQEGRVLRINSKTLDMTKEGTIKGEERSNKSNKQ